MPTPKHTPTPLLAVEGTVLTSRKAWARCVSGDVFRGEYAIEAIEGSDGGSVSGEVAVTTGEQRAKAIAAALRHDLAFHAMRDALETILPLLEWINRSAMNAAGIVTVEAEQKARAALALADEE